MSKLIIIESPNKIKKLKAILGNDYVIAASFGHVRDLPEDDIGIAAPEFDLKYIISQGSKDTVIKLKVLAQQADEVFLATDPDREGESISWHLQECLKLKNPTRITFNEITDKAVKAAMRAPRRIDMQLVEAQEARRGLDRLTGYMVSPKLSQATGQKLSAGRVQSPAVRIVVERERQIAAFRQTLHYGVKLNFIGNKGNWFAQWLTKPDFTNDDAPYLMDKTIADAVCEVKTVTVNAYAETQSKRSPPAPFTTSTLQQAASVTLGYDPKIAMDLAQKLFAAGHISYHRTDNPNISSDAFPDICKVATDLNYEVVATPRTFPAPEGAQAGHPAICPTHWEIEEAGDNQNEIALYKLIRLRAIASQLNDAVYAVKTAILTADIKINGKPLRFGAKGRTLINQGWLRLTAGDQTSEDEVTEADNPLPLLSEGTQLSVSSSELQNKKTQAPSRYTKASLVKKMESEGIGRPSTYASIIETIVDRRGYVALSGKYLLPTDIGNLLIDALVGHFEFVNLDFTNLLEKDLDLIATGKKTYKEVLSNTYSKLLRDIGNLNAAQSYEHHCPKCGAGLIRRTGKYGFFWSCSAYPGCEKIMIDKDGKPAEKPPAAEPSKYLCGRCKKPLIFRQGTTKAGKPYKLWGCSGYPKCDQSYSDDHGKPQFNQELLK
ncbi:type I DNA topoisomerase [Methylotenera sp.]|uniref:type I DNA topoisomerase n=1 Tax=Methylotenera sp. TaxID=2051956 RepID=UPI0027199C45|nr:type I DNA topoisomerase [Methylotenera sp.]MDO9205612.1 type I DNA topoisomerase [Methylotenera sp.]MDP2071825.1 type I DNA topoisomerase [Methylotenera sp.]